MKLIKMTFDRSSASVRQCLIDRQDLHKNIQAFFGASREESRVLYRITKDSIYVTASTAPITTESNGISVVAVKELTLPDDGEILRFNLFVRPYKKREGHRIPLTNEQARLEWLFKQGQRYGFEYITVRENGHGTIRSKLKGFEVEGFYYSGLIRVIDKDKIADALENGIGAEKAYGLGMLLVV